MQAGPVRAQRRRRRGARRREHDRRRRGARAPPTSARPTRSRRSTTCSCGSRREKGWDIPLHVDGASGAFIAPFAEPDLRWDFRLEQVASINASGPQVRPGLPGRRLADLPGRVEAARGPRVQRQLPRRRAAHVHVQLLARVGHDPGADVQLPAARAQRVHGDRREHARQRPAPQREPRGERAVRDPQPRAWPSRSSRSRSRATRASTSTTCRRGCGRTAGSCPAYSLPPDAEAVHLHARRGPARPEPHDDRHPAARPDAGVGRARRRAAGAAPDAPSPTCGRRPAHAAAQSKARTGLREVTVATVPGPPGGLAGRRAPAGRWAFVTHAVLARPDGSEVEWSSRRHRKGLGLRLAGRSGPRAVAAERDELVDRRPVRDRVALLRARVAAAVLRRASTRPSCAGRSSSGRSSSRRPPTCSSTRPCARPAGCSPSRRARGRLASLVGWKPRRIDCWAALVQLVGTVFFNISTFAATRPDLTLAQERHLVWAPDVVGSICFLVASWLAYAEVNRGVLPRSDRSVGWSIAALNLLGSVAFGVAAVAARYLRIHRRARPTSRWSTSARSSARCASSSAPCCCPSSRRGSVRRPDPADSIRGRRPDRAGCSPTRPTCPCATGSPTSSPRSGPAASSWCRRRRGRARRRSSRPRSPRRCRAASS